MQRETDELYMRRCLQLARCGQAGAKPNPMVGAVIVAPGGRIIGEGYHKRCGEGHAEVNAFASVRAEDEALQREYDLRLAGAVQPLWQDTTLCRPDRQQGREACGLRLRRSLRQGAGSRHRADASGWH